MDILNEIKKTVAYFESPVLGDMISLNKSAERIWNHFALDPNFLLHNEHPYITGIFYSYFELLFRKNENFNVAAVTNALFCFAKTMEGSAWNAECKCAAMRMFLLICDSAKSSLQILHDLFMKNCYKLSGYDYFELEDNIYPNSQEILAYYPQQIYHGIMSYCYSIFISGMDYDALNLNAMERLKHYISALNSTSYPLTQQTMDFSSHDYFNLFYKYLMEKIENRKNRPVLCIEYREDLNQFRLYSKMIN